MYQGLHTDVTTNRILVTGEHCRSYSLTKIVFSCSTTERERERAREGERERETERER
jgi:hypothetical protein